MSIGELMGYVASVLLAISLLVNGELKFRWINSFGCIAFIIYGVLIDAFPVTLTNSVLLLINAFQMVKYYRTTEAFDLVEFTADEKIVTKFLDFYDKDIQAYYPGFKLQNEANDIRFLVVRNMTIANIFIASVQPDGKAYVKINYTIPKYRDFKVGTYVFKKRSDYLRSQGVNEIIYTSVTNKGHADFLKRMGFVQQDGKTVKVL
jgi:hypothetical protein